MNELILTSVCGAIWVGLGWLFPSKWFMYVTTFCGAAFIFWLDPLALGLLSATGISSYLGVRWHSKHRGALVLTMALGALALLFGFKWIGGWVPLGMSYFIFRQIGYQVEAYKGMLPPHTPLEFATYNCLLPVILVGPIHRFTPFLKELQRRRWNLTQFGGGLERVVIGLFKVAFLGNFLFTHLGIKWVNGLSGGTYFYAESIRFAFNTYVQFAGFSDVAIGFAAMGGIRVMENFNWPFSAQNISDFWQRWHISLSSWCRDYVYVPLFASTRNAAFALFASLGLLAIWHDVTWNYFLWGLAHVLATLVYRVYVTSGGQEKIRSIHSSTRFIGHFLTFHFVVFSFTLIRTDTLAPIWDFWKIILPS